MSGVDIATRERAMHADLLVLDVHGVIFDNPLGGFLDDVGTGTGEGPAALRRRWVDTLRRPFWEGRLTEPQLWDALAPGSDHGELRTDLERRYGTGPWFDFVTSHGGTMWLLTNHRSEWLHPRLDRFGLTGRFDRIIVSDRIGAAKPSRRAFASVIGVPGAFFVDDSRRNVSAARRLGVDAGLVTGSP